LIETLKSKLQVLAKAYLEEHEKVSLYQMNLETILQVKRNLEETLADNDNQFTKLNKEIAYLKDEVAVAQARSLITKE